MNRKWINGLIIIVLLLIVAVVVIDYMSTRPGHRPSNPFAFDVSEYEAVDPSMVHYAETRQIRMSEAQPVQICSMEGNICLLTDSHLQIITPTGEEVARFAIPPLPLGVTVSADHTIFIAYSDHVIAFSPDGEVIRRSEQVTGNTRLTSLTHSGEQLFAADAGNRQVVVFSDRLELVSMFRGESGVSEQHGFILPSARFDLAINPENELWVVNPGLHLLQNYSHDGRFRRQWGKPSFDIDGFSGCCNPSYIAFRDDGRIVTSEKGLVRIKVYHESGELASVVAPPASFKNGNLAPAIAVLTGDIIAALDYDSHMIRIFEPIQP